MFHLASLATPAQPPMASHQRGSRLASSRMTSSRIDAQNTKSGVVVVSSCMAPRYSRAGRGRERGEQLAGPARAEAAGSSPPSSPPARPRQSAGSDPEAGQRAAGQRRRDSRASSGVSGGWST